jgi:NagD protein
MATALTLTGATDRRALITSPIQPDYVIESIGELIRQTEYNELQA